MTAPIDIRLIANLSPPDWWTISLTAAATILGAIIGAGIAFVVARQTAAENRQAAGVAKREVEEATAIRVGVKLCQLLSTVAGYHHQTEKYLAKYTQQLGVGKIEFRQFMQSPINRTDALTLDASHLVLFVKAK
jgi:hypothetical protein